LNFREGKKIMLNLVLNILVCGAIIGNVFLLMVIYSFGKNKLEDKAAKVGFRFMQVLMLLNILAIGGNVLWQKI